MSIEDDTQTATQAYKTEMAVKEVMWSIGDLENLKHNLTSRDIFDLELSSLVLSKIVLKLKNRTKP